MSRVEPKGIPDTLRGAVPTQGRIVIFQDGVATWPALVLEEPHALRQNNPEARVTLKVMTDRGDRIEYNVPYSEDERVYRTWHWPTRVP